MSKKKGLDIDTQKIVAWCKGNIILVILILVSIGAVVGFPRMAASWNDDVQSDLQQRASSFDELGEITKTKVTKPGSGESEKVVVNQALVNAYIEVTESLRGDAEQVVFNATAQNQKDYEVLFASSLFPAPSPDQKNTLPQLFHEQLEIEYMTLFESINAGMPPTREELSRQLEVSRVRYMETDLNTRHDADLTKEQRTGLENHLAKLRMAALRARAEDISVYMNESSLTIPKLDVTIMPEVGELFLWQWRYWVIADTLGFVSHINGNQTEVTSPIKRVLMLEVLGLPAVSDEPTSGGRGNKPRGGGPSGGTRPPRGGSPNPSGGSPNPSGGGSFNPRGGGPKGGGGPGLGGGGSGLGGGSSGGGSGRKPRSSEEGQLALSHTNRESGGLFDLLQVRISMIVDTNRIPVVLDGIASYNFFTVIDLDLQPVDKFVAFGQGYDYGSASVSRLTVVLESAWLRSWTTKYMPKSVKHGLGIKD